ncbi:MAG TPA: hypothetical protein DCE41_06965 [Cytophagales bacterium]|nr:hypothetical protein [Cytophagales bacterium]HAA22045.1 hypothetical protein [Cytophagales bacterium]HAP58584.1 hypothetical protein [Cytophagales bacterium]
MQKNPGSPCSSSECKEQLRAAVEKYEERVRDLEQEIYLMKEQMMAQRTMLKDAIDHGLHLQKQLDQYEAEKI